MNVFHILNVYASTKTLSTKENINPLFQNRLFQDKSKIYIFNINPFSANTTFLNVYIDTNSCFLFVHEVTISHVLHSFQDYQKIIPTLLLQTFLITVFVKTIIMEDTVPIEYYKWQFDTHTQFKLTIVYICVVIEVHIIAYYFTQVIFYCTT